MNQVTCDICGKLFLAKRKRWWCERCNEYFYVCPEDSKLINVPCPHCGSKLKKKAEPIKKI